MNNFIISLTSIPPRFGVLHETLRSLLAQSVKPDRLVVYLSRNYRRFGPLTELPQGPPGVEVAVVDEDYGPATKVLPAVKEYRERSDLRIIFCDDDKVYDPRWAARLLAASDQKPDCCIVEEGGDVCNYSRYPFRGPLSPRATRREKDLLYRLRRGLSLGLWKPRKTLKSGYVDILEGWGGVLVKPRFFRDEVFDIPDILWLVDDIWLSGNLALNSVPIWLTADEAIRTKGNSEEVKEAALRKTVYKDHNRDQANQACVDYFINKFGIWNTFDSN
jgi:GT2 family glycosyltransferase